MATDAHHPSTRILPLRRADICVSCAKPLAVGTQAQWDPERRAVTCLSCVGTTPGSADLAIEQIVSGPAGGSAAREAERRRTRQRARRDQLRAERPVLGRIALALSAEKDAGRSYASGAIGEEALGRHLDGLADNGVLVLHDRRIPGRRANIDHLAVAPTGVWVIDAKRYKGKAVERAWGRLEVGGRDQTKLVEGVQNQVAHVMGALERAGLGDVPVHGVLCFIDAEFGLLTRPFTVKDVLVVWRRALGKRLTQPGPIGGAARLEVQRALASTFRPAT